jgi:predicted permease
MKMAWMRRLWRRRQLEHELDKELRFHLDRQVEDLIAKRVEPQQARRQAKLTFGGSDQIKEACRDERGLRWIEDFARDLAHGARLLRRSPLFTVVAVASLALGIGANTAIFSLIDSVMLRSMPVKEPDKLVEFIKRFPPYKRGSLSHPLFEQLRTDSHSFAAMFAHTSVNRTEVSFGGGEEPVETALASADYYPTLGLPAFLGRTLSSEDERAAVAVISYAYWQRRFAGDPRAIGKTFRLNGTVFTIIGVTPRGFSGPFAGRAPEVTFPLKMDAEVRAEKSVMNNPGYNWLSVMARLKPGVSREQAQEEVSGIFRRGLEQEASQVELRQKKSILNQSMELRPAGNGFVDLSERFGEPLLALMGVVAVVLLIACSNLANLLLARATARRREISVRLAIGAGQMRIVRQLAAESLLLALLGGTLGIALALWLSNALIGLMSAGGPRMALKISPDLRVLAFTAAISAITCMIFGLIPAWQGSRVQVNPTLKESRSGERALLRRGLVVAQVALSLLLVIGAGLFARTLVNLYALDSGFERRGVLMFRVDMKKAGYKGDQIRAVQARILERLNAVPGVESASFAAVPPLSGGGWNGDIQVEGYTPRPDENPEAHFNAITPKHFLTLRTPILLGRDFTERDSANAPAVVIVNEAFAKRFYGGASPLGKRVNKAEVVGVVKDMKYRTFRQEIPPTAYWPRAQSKNPATWGDFFVRGRLATPVEGAVREIDQNLRVDKLRTLEEHVDNTILQERLLAWLAGFFGLVALIASCLGIYGMTAFQVTRRTNEIGIRIALGARGPQVVWAVLKEVLGLLLIGLAIGVPAALLLTRFAENLLFGLKPADAATYVTAAILLGVVAVAAGAVPAVRAARVDPMVALRYE